MRNDPETPAARAGEPAAASSRHAERINRALDHILSHLAGPLPLEAIAHAGGFSPFHFHRVFKAAMGETVNEFVRRQRLERALSMMSRRPAASLTSIALECGFASSSDFSRSFKQRYGVAPSRFDVAAWRETRRDSLLDHMEQTGARPAPGRLPPGENPDGFVARLRDRPPCTVAYRRVFRPFEGTAVVDAIHGLIAWAEARGVADRRWYGYMWEDPEVVPLEDCRYDIAVEVDDVRPDGFVGRYDFPAMRVAEVALFGDVTLELRALDWLFGTWLPASGFVPDDQPCFEAFAGRPFAHGTERFELAAQLPVRRP